MGRFLAYRFLALIASLVLASAVIFVVLRQLPGDAGGATLGVGTTADQLAQLRADLGTDLPVWQQYTTWIASLFDGSTTSFISREPVSDLIASKLPITVPLSLAAFVVAVLVSIPLGVLAGVYRDSPLGVIVSGVSQLGLAIPIFWVGVLLVWWFALREQWLPSGGFPRAGWADPGAAVQSLILPVVTIALAMSSVMVRYIRSATIDVVQSDYIRTARSLGYSLWGALARHGLRHMAVPVVAILGIELATSLLGAVVVENVFALPGLGTLLLTSVTGRDFPVVQNLILLLTAVVLIMNFAVEVIQRLLDPRLDGASATGVPA